MPRLGDFFEPGAREAHVARQLTPGHILWIPDCSIPSPPKPKFAVVAANAGDHPVLLLINSRVAPFVQRHPDMAGRQVLVAAACYDFLQHDSYIDCAQAHDSITWRDIMEAAGGSVDEVEKQLVKAILSADDRSAVVAAVDGASTVTEEHQDMIRSALQP